MTMFAAWVSEQRGHRAVAVLDVALCIAVDDPYSLDGQFTRSGRVASLVSIRLVLFEPGALTGFIKQGRPNRATAHRTPPNLRHLGDPPPKQAATKKGQTRQLQCLPIWERRPRDRATCYS